MGSLDDVERHAASGRYFDAIKALTHYLRTGLTPPPAASPPEKDEADAWDGLALHDFTGPVVNDSLWCKYCGAEWSPKSPTPPQRPCVDRPAWLWANVKAWLMNTAWQNGWQCTASLATAEKAFDYVSNILEVRRPLAESTHRAESAEARAGEAERKLREAHFALDVYQGITPCDCVCCRRLEPKLSAAKGRVAELTETLRVASGLAHRLWQWAAFGDGEGFANSMSAVGAAKELSAILESTMSRPADSADAAHRETADGSPSGDSVFASAQSAVPGHQPPTPPPSQGSGGAKAGEADLSRKARKVIAQILNHAINTNNAYLEEKARSLDALLSEETP